MKKWYHYIILLFLITFCFLLASQSSQMNISVSFLKTMMININLDFNIFLMNQIFSLVVIFVLYNILNFNLFYMESTKNYSSFIAILLTFAGSMIMLLTSGNFFMLITGWDMLGVSSFFLVIFFSNLASQNSGMLTIMMNRMGDLFFIIFFSMMLFNFFEYFQIFVQNNSFIMVLFFLLITITKSAMFPFSSWLPFAMAAPTPISALVHSSTLVAAGIMLILLFFEFLKSMVLIWFLVIIGLLGSFYSGLFSLVEKDFKKMVALSTLNQLAFIFVSLCLVLKEMSFFHLSTHAFFKSLLFMCVGVILHQMFNNQDSRLYIYGYTTNNLVNFSFVLTLLNLTGLIFTTGFFSKDMVLEKYMISHSFFLLKFVFLLSIGFTFIYSFRMVMFTMHSNNYSFIQYSSFSKILLLTLLLSSLEAAFFSFFYYWNFPILIFLSPFISMKAMLIFILFITLMLIYINMFTSKKMSIFFSNMVLQDLIYKFYSKFKMPLLIIQKKMNNQGVSLFLNNSFYYFTFYNSNYKWSWKVWFLLISYFMIFIVFYNYT